MREKVTLWLSSRKFQDLKKRGRTWVRNNGTDVTIKVKTEEIKRLRLISKLRSKIRELQKQKNKEVV